MVERGPQGHVRAAVVADHGEAPVPEGAHEGQAVGGHGPLGVGLVAGGGRRLGRLAVAPRVGADHGVRPGQQRRHPVPGGVGPRVAVQQQHGRPGPAVADPQDRLAHVDPLRVKPSNTGPPQPTGRVDAELGRGGAVAVLQAPADDVGWGGCGGLLGEVGEPGVDRGAAGGHRLGPAADLERLGPAGVAQDVVEQERHLRVAPGVPPLLGLAEVHPADVDRVLLGVEDEGQRDRRGCRQGRRWPAEPQPWLLR